MFTLLRLLFTPIGLILVGLGAVVFGGRLYWVATHERLPERSELTQFNGIVTAARKILHERKGVVTLVEYELEVTPANRQVAKVRLPEKTISEQQVALLNGAPITVLLRDNKPSDVWELSYGRMTIVEYAKTLEQSTARLADDAENGPYMAGGGLAALGVGGFWFARRHRNTA